MELLIYIVTAFMAGLCAGIFTKKFSRKNPASIAKIVSHKNKENASESAVEQDDWSSIENNDGYTDRERVWMKGKK